MEVYQGATAFASSGTYGYGDIVINIINASPYIYDYPEPQATFTIRNTGTATLHLTGLNPDYVLKSGTDSGLVTIISQPAASIAAGASSDFTVKVQKGSGAPKSYTAALTIPSDDPAHATYAINLTWRWKEPHITLSATSLAFGTITANKDLTFSVTNDGTVDLQVWYDSTAFNLSQSPAERFGVFFGLGGVSSPTTIASGDTATVTVRMTYLNSPPAKDYAGTLTMMTNDPETNDRTRTVSVAGHE